MEISIGFRNLGEAGAFIRTIYDPAAHCMWNVDYATRFY